jgi:hypothetical protein
MNKNSMLYWWPRIQNCDVPMPVTCMTDDDCIRIDDLVDGVFGYPVFIRTDLGAGKHDWDKGCFVRNADELKNHLQVIQQNEMWRAIGMEPTAIMIREFLELESPFTAFAGNMPINVERRYFISQGKVVCHHPYWPPETFESGHPDRQPHDPDWRAKLEVMNTESEQEVALLTEYAERVGAVMPEYWSVDFAKTRQGKWYLIDMALGVNSFHWPGCTKVLG